jgi:hypothetical protein
MMRSEDSHYFFSHTHTHTNFARLLRENNLLFRRDDMVPKAGAEGAEPDAAQTPFSNRHTINKQTKKPMSAKEHLAELADLYPTESNVGLYSEKLRADIEALHPGEWVVCVTCSPRVCVCIGGSVCGSGCFVGEECACGYTFMNTHTHVQTTTTSTKRTQATLWRTMITIYS